MTSAYFATHEGMFSYDDFSLGGKPYFTYHLVSDQSLSVSSVKSHRLSSISFSSVSFIFLFYGGGGGLSPFLFFLFVLVFVVVCFCAFVHTSIMLYLQWDAFLFILFSVWYCPWKTYYSQIRKHPGTVNVFPRIGVFVANPKTPLKRLVPISGRNFQEDTFFYYSQIALGPGHLHLPGRSLFLSLFLNELEYLASFRLGASISGPQKSQRIRTALWICQGLFLFFFQKYSFLN